MPTTTNTAAQAAANPPMADARSAAPITPPRLYAFLRPDRYAITLKVDPDSGTFEGTVAISAKAAKTLHRVTLHAIGLTVREASVDGQAVPAGAIAADAEAQTLSWGLGKPVPAGRRLAITIAYSGKLDANMRGLYASSYRYEGKLERYAFTQFEPADFRRMVPSVDEPAAKAVFQLTVTAPAGLTALSNMPARSREVAGGWQTVAFEDSPRMSSYLVALAVARLKSRSAKAGKTLINVWATPDKMDQTSFALQAAKQSVAWLNAYFAIPYQLPKLDLVAVPDFSAGAMENWGAIFFRDSAIFVDPKLSSTRAQRRVAEVVSHEIVHQWFGDLVTMKWWNDLWLNEAFATWGSVKVVGAWKPQWNAWLDFQSGVAGALDVDALNNTRPIESGAATIAEIEAQFDVLSYEKGAAVLRMMERYLGEGSFQKGIRAYMRRYSYKNTEARDLWRELERASKVPITRMARDWFTQPGFPLVTARLSADGKAVEIRQSRFFAAGGGASAQTWTIPVVMRFQTASDKTPRALRVVAEKATTRVPLPGRGAISWLYPNEGQTGFYRSALEGKLLADLKPQLVKSLDPAERAGFLGDSWAETVSGALAIGGFMDNLEALRADKSRFVLQNECGLLKLLWDRLLEGAGERERFSAFTESFLSSHWTRLGWGSKKPGDSETELARASVLGALGAIAPGKTLGAQIEERLARYLEDPSSLNAALARPVLEISARRGDASLFETYQSKMLQASSPEERDEYLRAMAFFPDPALARRLLELALSADVRGQDAWKPVTALLANPKVQGEAWKFVAAHWPALRRKSGEKGADRVISATSALWSPQWRSDVERFFTKPENEVPSARRSLKQALEEIDLGVRVKAQAPALAAWLASRP